MAHIRQPLTEKYLSQVIRRPEDNLPDYIKGKVEWRTTHSKGPGYYVLHPETKEYLPVEFIHDHWHKLYVYTETTFTSLTQQIPPNRNTTGYWKITDWQHPENTSHKEAVQYYHALAAERAFHKIGRASCRERV